MAGNGLTIHGEGDSLEGHIVTLLEKLETVREVKETMADSGGIAKNYRQPIQVEIRTLEFWRSIISECLASFFFVFIVCGSSFGKGIDKSNDLSILSTALATGLAMALLHHCFERISGGHVNPAVSIAMAVVKKISPLRAALFVVAQCGGGIAGASLLYGVTPGPYPVSNSPVLGPWERFGVELVLSFIVVFAHFSKLESRRIYRDKGSTVIGVAYAACTLAGMPMLNPARALGPAFVMNKLWDNHWVFWFGPVFGGILAAIIHEFIFNSKRQSKRPADSIDGDSSIHSEDEPFEDNKYHPAAYRPVGSGNPTSPVGGYCPSVASTSVYSSPPGRVDRAESICNGNKYKTPPHGDGIYSGARSLYNAKITEGIYSGTKSMYTKSPVLTRSNLNRSQSVYTKSQNPRDLLPKPGPLIPAQSLYPIKLGNGGHLSSNIRDFGSPAANFISGIKTNDGNFIKVPQGSDQNGGNGGFNQGAMNFLAGRNGTSKSYHDVTDADKSNFQQQQQQQNFSVGDHLTNQNVQNQHLLNLKPEKNPAENIYGIRNTPTGGIYPGNDPPRPENKREVQGGKRECYDSVPRGHDNRSETSRSQASSNFNRTAAYVKSIQNNPGTYKTRDSNYDIVPSGIREVPNFSQKPHNRSDTSDYGSNSLTNQFSE